MNKKPVMRAIRLEEALADLMDAENILSKLEGSEVFQAFSDRQKRGYYRVLGELRGLLADMSKDTSLELAS
jgi:hypothetical protein